MARDHRRLAAIVSIDVVGYSRLMGVDESGTLTAFKAHRRELIDLKIAEHAGRIVKTTGDGLLLEFPSVVDAVRCAVEIQSGMAERNAGNAADKRLDFRIGINVGDIIIDGDDIFGDGVNVAARVEGLAEPGGICVSRAVRDQVLDKLSFIFEDLGPHQVKNIARPVDVYRVNLAHERPQLSAVPHRELNEVSRRRFSRWLAMGVVLLSMAIVGGWWKWTDFVPASPSSPRVGSLAVLPFTTSAAGTDDERLAQSVTVDLTSALQRSMTWTSVVSHSLARAYTDRVRDARQIGQTLNVRYVVEGEVQRVGTRTLAKVRLIETREATEAWSDDVVIDDSGSSPDPLTLVPILAGRVHGAVIDAEARRVFARPVNELSAAELAFRGDEVARRDLNSPAAWAEAARLYEMALRLEPNETSALMGQALVLGYTLALDLDPGADRDSLRAEYDKLTVRLITMAGREARSWAFRADALAQNWRWEAALEAIDKSQALDPARRLTPVYRMDLLYRMGRPSDALTLGDQLLSQWPLEYDSIADMHTSRCAAMLALGRYADAISACEKASSGDDSWFAHMYLAAAYALGGNVDKAKAHKVLLLSRKPNFSIARHKAMRISDRPAYLEQTEAHLYAGLRKADIK